MKLKVQLVPSEEVLQNIQGNNLTLRELGKSKSRRINAPKKI